MDRARVVNWLKVLIRLKVSRPSAGRVRASRLRASRLRGGGARGVLRAGAVAGPVLLGLTLAACGSIHASATGAAGPAAGAASTASAKASASPSSAGSGSGSAALCRDAATVTGLQIVHEGVRQPELQIAFPGEVTVSSPAQARAVARALCALPAMPAVVFHCPAMFQGTTYQLNFTLDGRRLPAVTIEASGCETVTGIGPVRRAGTSPGFWRVLATSAGMRPPGRPVFSGTNPTGPTCQPPSQRLNQINGCPGVAKPGGAAKPGGVAVPGGVAG